MEWERAQFEEAVADIFGYHALQLGMPDLDALQTRIEALASASPIEKYPAERLRLLNDLYPDKQPVAGQWLKVVD